MMLIIDGCMAVHYTTLYTVFCVIFQKKGLKIIENLQDVNIPIRTVKFPP